MKFAIICDIKEKWKAIAAHVGTRDVRACADRFKASDGTDGCWGRYLSSLPLRCVVNVRWSNRRHKMKRWKESKRKRRKRLGSAWEVVENGWEVVGAPFFIETMR